MHGILVQCSTGGEITDNVFIQNEVGILTEALNSEGINGIRIEGNEIRDCNSGIVFQGANESLISNNVIRDNGPWGIAIDPSTSCSFEEPGHECFYSTGNVVADNVVEGHITDLFHHEECVGNTWERNTCATKQGSEIPDCTPGDQ